MRIAQVAPLYESVPPSKYGGTERVVSYLTEELVRQGHEVTLFASGDSVTSATLVSTCERALRLDSECIDPLAAHVLLIEEVFRRVAEFDVIHFHIDYLHFPVSTRMNVAHLTTLHGRLDLPYLPAIYRTFPQEKLISISDSQRVPLAWINWLATVYHGIPKNLYKFDPSPEDYLVFVGRVSPEKGVDRAIEIAKRCGRRLCIAAKVDKVDREYFQTEIKPLLKHPSIEFIGEVSDQEKQRLIGKAAALLFPIDWPEPFGLVMVESMACGTPVVAFRRGSVPEIVAPGATGFIAESIEDAVVAVDQSATFDRRLCRQIFESRFSAGRMARDYVRQYENLQGQDTSGVTAGISQCH